MKPRQGFLFRIFIRKLYVRIMLLVPVVPPVHAPVFVIHRFAACKVLTKRQINVRFN